MENFIVIGTDCSGKTSLVNMLADTLGYNIVKGSSFELSKCNQSELYNKFLEFTTYQETVFDRFSYCNKVYASLYEGYPMLTHEQRRDVEFEMYGKVIYLYADDDVLIERFNTRGDDDVDIETILKAKRLYEEELKHIQLEVIKYNTGKMSTYEIVEDILLNH